MEAGWTQRALTADVEDQEISPGPRAGANTSYQVRQGAAAAQPLGLNAVHGASDDDLVGDLNHVAGARGARPSNGP